MNVGSEVPLENSGVVSEVQAPSRHGRRMVAVGMLITAATSLFACGGSADSGKNIATTTMTSSEAVDAVLCGDGSGEMPDRIDPWGHGDVEQVGSVEDMVKQPIILTYDLQRGETLQEVARCYFQDVGSGMTALQALNKIPDQDAATTTGQIRIVIDHPMSVKLDDTVATIDELAYETGLPVAQIFAANGHLFEPDNVDSWSPGEGDTINLPVQLGDYTVRVASSTTPASSTSTVRPETKQAPPTTTITTPEQESDNNEVLEAFITKWMPYAVEVQKKYGIDKNAVLSQAILESTYGSSDVALNANNLFGIKAHEGAAKTTYWKGSVFKHQTPEYLTEQQLKLPEFKGATVVKKENGRVLVLVSQPFRAYEKFEYSFLDYGDHVATTAVYKDAFASRKDPKTYLKKIASHYATDPIYVSKLLTLLEGLQTIERAHPDVATPDKGEKRLPSGNSKLIDLSKINFKELPDQPRDAKLQRTMTEAIESLSLDEFAQFTNNGIRQKSDHVKKITAKDPVFYQKALNSRPITPEYFVWHLWASGVAKDDQSGGTPNSAPTGNSHDITMESLVISWFNNYHARPASANFVLGDNGQVWQLTERPFERTLSVGTGIKDEGKESFPHVSNENTVAIEVQADTVYDATATEYKELIYWTADMLLLSGKVTPKMSEAQINKVVMSSEVGHGKDMSRFNHSGLEFGWRYTRPLVAALQQFMVQAVK